MITENLQQVTKHNPCPHCGKPDWCYFLGELSVCKRDAEPAPGWKMTSKQDKEGSYYYAPEDKTKKTTPPSQTRTWEYPDRDRNPLVRVIRIDDGSGGKPKRWQEHWNGQKWVKGLKGIKRADIPIYRYQEIQEAIAKGKTIFIVEGEVCADALWKLGIPATTNIGGSGKWRPSDTQDLADAVKIVLCPDRDKPGVKHMETIATDFKDAQWLYAFPNSPFWHKLPQSGGIDVADWIEDYNLTKAQIWEAVEPYRQELPNPEVPTTPPPATKHYPQMCIEALFSDTHWISFNGKLYKWVGTHYQQACRVQERRRIVHWCDTTPVETKTGWKYAYADATHVENIWKWVLEYFEVSPDEINPPGINCLNGVVKINWNGAVASWELVPHDPQVIYTYVSEFNFDPDADSTQCDRMLSCLEPQQQQLFIQTMAASLDLATIRKYRGRTVKALLCKGEGNNGKDTLREAVRLLFGEIGMSDATIGDFKAYDNGRKFDLAKLEGTRINWSSENSSFDELDRIESLKKAITGESLDMERKGVDSHTMNLSTVFLFNVNEAPNLKAGLEAIQSRWAVLNFNKTYKINADPNKGELEADSRFRYDPYFIKEQVCPALLNKMLLSLEKLAVNGIDYSCTEQALQDIQKETNHLWAFVQDMGLEYQTGSKVYINDLWELLREWYINNGTLEIIATDKGKEKKIWHDQPRRSDRNVKAPNQVYQRFAELFPKIKKEREKKNPQRKGQFYLTDIRFSEANRVASEAVVKQSVKHQNQSQSESEANKAKNPITQAKKIIGELNKSDQKALISWLKAIEENQPNSSSTPNKNLSTPKNLAKGGKIASPASPVGTVSITASPTASLTASPDKTTASLTLEEQNASLASTAYQERVTASAHSSKSESFDSSTFEIGSRVANNNPDKKSYNWHGTIVGFDLDGADVRWDERKGMKGGQVLWHRLSELRLL
ncbi:MAG: DUF5906 domain-containing protein [Xenococcaceae cyanobacterium MO_234.B1]|nr:DUF5906 domain-containing protein [Xenococcaceae cyanobacterium MO_234.B1]